MTLRRRHYDSKSVNGNSKRVYLIGWSSPLIEQQRHLPHKQIDMHEERPVARAEVIES
jgi:hypothetical protein